MGPGLTIEAATEPGAEERAAAQGLAEKLRDRWWRLCNLYTVEDKQGRVTPFRPNRAQRRLYERLARRNIIPKARQLGFTTFILLMMLDACLFNSNTRCAVIAHDKDSATELFQQKVKAVYDRLPDWLKAIVPARRDQAMLLNFANGSQIRVTTSARSGTVQWLLVSEHGKICARYPAKAKEIRTGALPAAPLNAAVFVESTGEGPDGDFYEWCQSAARRADQGVAATPLDLKLHFFPWWEDPDYRLPAGALAIDETLAKYFAELEEKHGVALDDEQRAWYAKTAETQREEMLREYPSVYEEVFKTAIEGAFFTLEMQALRRSGRLGFYPYEPAAGPVHFWWDIGVDDYTAVWGVQLRGREIRLVFYKEWTDVGLPTVHRELGEVERRENWVRGRDVVPHDIEVLEWGNEATRREVFRTLRGEPIIAPSPPGIVGERIGIARNVFPRIVIHEATCGLGVKRLDAYRREWDERLSVWKSQPRHDEASHGASAFGVGLQMLELLPVAGGGALPPNAGGSPGGYVPRTRAA